MVESIERKPSICGNEIAKVQQNINCVPNLDKFNTKLLEELALDIPGGHDYFLKVKNNE